MNIFILDLSPEVNVQYYVNRHVTKMPLETAQLLSMALYLNNGNKIESDTYKPCKTHLSHPCTLWAAKSVCNFKYLYRLGKAISQEYTFRYGKRHASENVMENCLKYMRDVSKDMDSVPDDVLPSDFALAMSDECKIHGDVVASYRNYYIKKKQHLAQWKIRPIPHWFIFKTNPDWPILKRDVYYKRDF